MKGIWRHIPNWITASRLLFAAGFLLLLLLARARATAGASVPPATQWRLLWGFVLFVVAGLTDIIDGPLARRWRVTSSFGRRFDPFVDKILIGGGFILLALYGPSVSGIAWWMVIVILAREILVTLLRQISESQGQQFAATWAGKLKMFLQSFAIGTVIIYIAYHQEKTWAVIFRDTTIWLALAATVLSALIYLPRMKRICFGRPASPQSDQRQAS
ncbi:MAG: CDP-diacylglycerol--glycerol-3-phosphate 3-phosphatidyltransferase [Sedimentisphaerales bacterium]|nr:CDP-diacylglycerol--glycerol-3-phosphate 3-phosphatidyltransferase [Sedimentisphaerales bacterium]